MNVLKYFILMAILSSSMLYALPKDVQFDILKTKLSKKLKAEDYNGVLETIDEIKELDVNTPNSLLFIEGKALLKSGNASASYVKLEEYLNKTGKNGKYYKQALSYILEDEETIKKEKAERELRVEKEKKRRIHLKKEAQKLEDDCLYYKSMEESSWRKIDTKCSGFDNYPGCSEEWSKKAVNWQKKAKRCQDRYNAIMDELGDS